MEISNRMRDRIRKLLVGGGVALGAALDEANSITDGLGYYARVTSSTGLSFAQAYDGIDVHSASGDLLETIAYDRPPDDDLD